MAEDRRAGRHRVVLDSRERCSVSGVTEVVSFDEACVVAETEAGLLVVKGSDLRVSNLNVDNGVIDVEGDIDGVTYEERVGRGKGSLFARVFK